VLKLTTEISLSWTKMFETVVVVVSQSNFSRSFRPVTSDFC